MSLEMVSSRQYLKEFKHIQCIGIGAFGSVFRAKDLLLGIDYAVKRILISQRKCDGGESFRYALREAEALAKLDHPNIVKFNSAWIEEISSEQQHEQETMLLAPFSSGLQESFSTSGENKSFTSAEYDSNSNHCDQSLQIVKKKLSKSTDCKGTLKYLYIQMELCEKENLKDWLFSDKRTLTSSRNIFSQILSAVAYIHQQKLIHRDLKPNNIFFSSDNTIKVGDFGLVVKHSGFKTLEKHTGDVGTELYMSPELIAGKPYNCKVDVYALGIIFYELLVKFDTEMERVQTLQSIRKKRFPADFKRDFSVEHKIIDYMLLEDPTKRICVAKIMKKLPATGWKSDLEICSAVIPSGRNLLPTFTTTNQFYLPIIICKNQIHLNIYKTLDSKDFSLYWLTEKKINRNFPSFAVLKKAGAVALVPLSFRQSVVFSPMLCQTVLSNEFNVVRSYIFRKTKSLIQHRVWYIIVQTDIKFRKEDSLKFRNKNDQKIIKLEYFTDGNLSVNVLKYLPDISQVREEFGKVVFLNFPYEQTVSSNSTDGTVIYFRDSLNKLGQPVLEMYL